MINLEHSFIEMDDEKGACSYTNTQFCGVIRLAERLFNVPIVAVSYLDDNGRTLITTLGENQSSLPISQTFCEITLRSEKPFIVEDASTDSHFSQLPMVTGPLGVSFYAGQRLVDHDGKVVGALCIFDKKPRKMSANDRALLLDLAQLVEVQMSKMVLERRNSLLRKEKNTLRSILNVDNSMIQSVDKNGRFIFTNAKWEKRLGYAKSELAAMNIFEILAPSELSHCKQVFEELKRSPTPKNVVTKFRTKDGEVFPVSGVVDSVVLASGQWISRGLFSDLTHQTDRLIKLTKSFDGFDEIAASLTDVFWLLNAASGRVLYVSPAYEKIWGRSRQALYSDSVEWQRAIHQDDRARVIAAIDEAITKASSFDIEFRIVTKGGAQLFIHNRGEPVFNENGQIIRLAGVATDITSRKELETKLREVAETDDLTGLMSRKRFEFEVNRILSGGHAKERPVSMAIIDLDHFKSLNDSHGHSTGDSVLVHFAEVLRHEIRSADIPARIGGDEFCVILEGANIQATQKVMARVLDSFGKHNILKIAKSTSSDSLTCSIGIAEWNQNESFADLRERADSALYASKKAGRGTIRIAPN